MEATADSFEEAHRAAVSLKGFAAMAQARPDITQGQREGLQEVAALAAIATRLLFEVRFED